MVTPAQIEQAVLDAILEQLRPEGWRQSLYPFDVQPVLDSNQVIHRSLAVAAVRSTALDSRQPRGFGAPTQTLVAVRFTWRIPEGGEHRARQEALDAELAVVAAVMQTRLDVRWVGSPRRQALSPEHMLIETQFEITHVYPLQACS